MKESRSARTPLKSNRRVPSPPRAASAAAAARLARREERQRIGLEDPALHRVFQRQGPELIDVLLQVLDSGTGPVGPPQDPLRDVREAREILEQFRRRDPGDVEPDV